MIKFSAFLPVLILSAWILGFSSISNAQVEKLQGKVMYIWFRDSLQKNSTVLSGGTLVQLQGDPNFAGDQQAIVNAAATILDGYTVVNRGGYFPENKGIPRNKQITWSEAVYRIYTLPNGTELVLYRSPSQNTAEYVIRKQ